MEKSEYIQLVNQAKKHSYLYYVESKPEISDAEFDALIAKIEQYEASHPVNILPDSPTQAVGSDLGDCSYTIAHRTPMLSQQKAHSVEDVESFINDAKALLGADKIFHIEWKYDGISCSLVYQDGKLISAATRGDGRKGKDIMAHVQRMASVPKEIKSWAKGRFEVRGEIVCPKGKHVALGYKDERTAASAICNSRDCEASESLVFMPWEMIREGSLSFSDYFLLADDGFYMPDAMILHEDGKTMFGLTIDQVLQKAAYDRQNYEYPTDGLVIKVDNYNDYQSMGATSHHPKGSIAYKFDAQGADTVVRSIEIKVGKTGRRTPVAHIDPVTILGRTIAKISLCTEKTMNSLGVREGSAVRVVLQNDVTPKIAQVLSNEPESPNLSDSDADVEKGGELSPIEENDEQSEEKERKLSPLMKAFIMVTAVAIVAGVILIGAGLAAFFLPMLCGAFKPDLLRT